MWEMFTPGSTRAVIADWTELELLRTGKPFYTDSMLLRNEEVTREPDHDEDGKDAEAEEGWDEYDPEILQVEAENLREAIWDELQLRQDHLGDLYPFKVEGLRNGGWKLSRRQAGSDETEYAHWMYLTTLAMSGVRNRHIKRRKPKGKDPEYSAIVVSLAAQFQHISALSASNYYGTETVVYSFGWPRRDGSDFRDALKDLVDSFGNGKVKKKVPANSKGHEKDGTVDLVVWRKFTSPYPGDPLLYGQVASGRDWTEKPVETYLRTKFLKWFKHPPTSNHTGATFMPFVQHVNVTAAKGHSMRDAIAEERRDNAAVYGQMFDRLRLTELFGPGLGPSEQRHLCEDPDDVLQRAKEWIQSCWDYCDGSTESSAATS